MEKTFSVQKIRDPNIKFTQKCCKAKGYGICCRKKITSSSIKVSQWML